MLSRRGFLEAIGGAAGALVIGVHLPGCRKPAAIGPLHPNAWLRITPDNRVIVAVEIPELGQGSRTYVPMMVAEELEVEWSTIEVEQAPCKPAIYRNLRTGGSGGVVSMFEPMRRAGAQAREMLIGAAAEHWNVARDELHAERGAIVHRPTGRRIAYGELVELASKLPVPAADRVPLKPAAQFKLLGTAPPRTDVPSKVDGTATFGIDVRVPGMLFAVIARCPMFGGTLAKLDRTAALAVPGVRAVFPVPPLPRHYNTSGGVVVVADSTWAAIQGKGALVLAWQGGEAETTAQLRERVVAATAGPPTFVAIERGDALGAMGRAARTIESDYESPFQAHATMEPMNTTVHVRDGEIEVWSPTQFGDEVQAEIAALAHVPADRVVVHMTLAGGSFGRRYQWDYAAEAWQVAKEVRKPVQLMWTREDDMQHDFYRPYNHQRLRAGLDEHGKLVAWSTRVVSTPIAKSNLYTGQAESPTALLDPKVVAALEWYGGDPGPYAVANVRLDYAPAESVVPRSWWRGVSASYTTFAKECFVDELALAAGRDPLAFRLDLLGDHPAAAIVRLAGEKAGWGKPMPPRHALGLACRIDDSSSAHVAEVAVADDGTVRVLRVTAIVACGLAVNPDGVKAMTEGGINFGLGPALYGEITIAGGRVEQSNFHDYQVLRFHQAPEIDVHIVPSLADPSGVGELAAMVIAPAVANSVFAATGVRVRRLPIDTRALQRR